jgi:glycerol-3-phosphate acyltransferase PlsY
VYGRAYGIPVVLLDVLKGFVPAIVGIAVSGDLLGAVAGGAAMAGHWHPAFLGFQRGGKMAATGGGVLLALSPLLTGIELGIFLLVLFLFGIPSVATLSVALTLPPLAFALGEGWPTIAFAGAASVGVVITHRENIKRLLHGQETRTMRGLVQRVRAAPN